MSLIDKFLNKITMYHLVLHYLIALTAIAGVFGALGILPINPIALAFSIALLIFICLTTNELFAWTFKAQPNSESVYITALILALIITPTLPTNVSGVMFLILAGVIAMASKYILAINKKHIFNPAAIAVAITALAFGQYASWWIGGNLPMLAFVLIGGLLVVRKIQRFDLVLTFFFAALISCIIVNAPLNPWEVIQKAVIHTSLLFFAFVMITEPLTTPPTRERRMIYGAFVGLMFAPGIHIGGIYSTPELALIIGNLLSYAMSPKSKHVLTLTEKKEVGKNLYDFVFTPDKPITFKPGQYMEWTLGHKNNDNRGNRRYFTIASSPTESQIHLGVRFNEPSSSFKKGLLEMKLGETIVAGQLAGDFTIPRNVKEKMVFIAGGIGITPFRSMVKNMIDRNEKQDVVLFYSNRTQNEIAYQEVFDEAAQKIGMKTVYALTNATEVPSDPKRTIHLRRIDAKMVQNEIPDYRDRTFYISGTHEMTTNITAVLQGLGVPRNKIKTDFFPGF